MIDFKTTLEITDKFNTLRCLFPGFARELDRCLFEILNNHTPKCGHGTCSCQMDFARFHRERNLQFGTEKKSCEFD